MSKLCWICVNEMPKDRKGWEQVCPDCRKKGHKELVMSKEKLEPYPILKGETYWERFWRFLAKVCLRRAGCCEYDIDKALEDI